MRKKTRHTHPKHRHFRYKNVTLLTISLLLAWILYHNATFHEYLLNLGSWGYLGAFLAGMLFVSSFTVATGAVVLLGLTETLIPAEIAVLAGLGAVVGDLAIFRFVKDGLVAEVKPLFVQFGGNHLVTLLHTPYFSWSLPLIGALIIASPFPDEIGASLLGIAKMKTVNFALLSFVLNSLGIFMVVSAAAAMRAP